MTSARLLLALLLALLAPAAPAAAQFTWAPAVPLGVPMTGNGGVVASTVAKESVAAIRHTTDGESRILVAWLDPAGNLVGPLEIPTANGGGGGLELAADGRGNVVVAWSESRGAVRIARRPANGVFGLPETIVEDGGSADLAVNERGDIGVSWHSYAGWHAVVIPHDGAVPTTPVELGPPVPGGPTDLAMTGTGELVGVRTVSAMNGNPAFAEVVVLPPGGKPALQRLYEGPAEMSCPVIAAGSGGEAVAAWKHLTGYTCEWNGPVYAALRAPGKPFGPAAAAPGGARGTSPVVSVDGSGRALLGFNAQNAIAGTGTVVTAPSGGAWSTSTTMPGMIWQLSGAHVAFDGGEGATSYGPLTARVAADGTLADLQDVTPDCRGGLWAFAVDPSGRGAGLLAAGYTEAGLVRQVEGTPAPPKCGPPPNVTVTQPEPAEPIMVAPKPPVAKPKLRVTARRGARRSVIVRITGAQPAARLTLRIPGRRALRSTKLTLRLGKADWRALARRGGTVTVQASLGEWRWTVRRTLRG